MSLTAYDALIDCTRPGAFSGSWQIAALANVIHRDIESVYPKLNGILDSAARMLNITFEAQTKQSRQKVYIMWSHVRLPRKDHIWTPLHFVPLVEGTAHPNAVVIDDSEPQTSRYIIK